MNIIYLLLYIVAAVCFGLAAFTGRSTVGPRGGGRSVNVNLVAAGLLAWVLVSVLQQLQLVDD